MSNKIYEILDRLRAIDVPYPDIYMDDDGDINMELCLGDEAENIFYILHEIETDELYMVHACNEFDGYTNSVKGKTVDWLIEKLLSLEN